MLPVAEVAPALLSNFHCGKPHLDSFLIEASVRFHFERLGHTTVVFHADTADAVVAYFTLANEGIPLTTTEEFGLGVQGRVALSSYPAIKLGRLAVRDCLQGSGVGKQVMNLIVGEALDSTALSAARLLVVDADNDPKVLSFYRAIGFQESLWAKRQARHHATGRQGGSPTAVKMLKDIMADA